MVVDRPGATGSVGVQNTGLATIYRGFHMIPVLALFDQAFTGIFITAGIPPVAVRHLDAIRTRRAAVLGHVVTIHRRAAIPGAARSRRADRLAARFHAGAKETVLAGQTFVTTAAAMIGVVVNIDTV